MCVRSLLHSRPPATACRAAIYRPQPALAQPEERALSQRWERRKGCQVLGVVATAQQSRAHVYQYVNQRFTLLCTVVLPLNESYSKQTQKKPRKCTREKTCDCCREQVTDCRSYHCATARRCARAQGHPATSRDSNVGCGASLAGKEAQLDLEFVCSYRRVRRPATKRKHLDSLLPRGLDAVPTT